MYRADGAGVGVSALIPHDPDTLDGEKHGEGLPDLLVESGSLDFLHYDVVGFLQQRHSLGCDLSQDADRQSWPGKRLALENFSRHVQVAADAPHFILEQIA